MQLQFNGTKSKQIFISIDISQKSSLSSLLYIYYNVNLLNIALQHRATDLEFIDDIVYKIQDKLDKENTRKIMHILNDAKKWKKKYKIQFEIFKYTLIHYIRNKIVKSKASV